jgi:nitrite reductase/ring-hydroxylating ferredoxin subunit
MTITPEDRPVRYIRSGQLFDSIQGFDPKHAVSRGEFSIAVPGLLKDMEWNQMDQLHRPFIHRTYRDNLRIALGRDFAVSLTRWGRWSFLITVTDTRVAEGVYYQDFVLGGMIFIHNTITLREQDEIVHLKIEWLINSHRFLKPLHPVLGRMFYKLNVRLQEEDSVIRSQRYRLRKKGYAFRSDPPDYYNSNQLTNNTVYPELPEGACIRVDTLPMHETTPCMAGDMEFLVRRGEGEVLIWPSACPHEGGELGKGRQKEDCRIECPWHGLKINGARMSLQQPKAENYGFSYTLEKGTIHIRKD